ncbi:MAG: hypothetical protein ACRBFS_13110 [Aureispira sp.]
MKTENNFLKRYREDLLLHLAFLIWAIFAAYYYQERLYSDSGFYLAKVVHYESFWVELGRYVLVFSQWLPLLCIKLGMGMKAILLAYSVGHVLFYYSIYLFCRYYWKEGHIGWWLIGIQCIGLLHGFCAPAFESYYNAGFLVLWALLLTREKRSWPFLLGVVLLSLLAVANYALAIIFFGAVLLLHATRYGLKAWPIALATIVGIGLGLLLKKTLLTNAYEAAKMDWFWHQLQYKHFSWEEYIRPLLGFYATYYKELFLIAVGTTGYYLRQKNYSTIFVYWGLLVGTQYVIALTYSDIRHSRYQEQCYFPLIMLGCFPLMMDILPQLKDKARYGVQVGLLGLVIYRFFIISDGIAPFKLRVAYLHRMIEKGREQSVYKWIMEEESLNSNVNDPSFTFGMESLLLSALNPEKRAVQVIRDTEWAHANNQQTLQDPTLYLGTYRSYYERLDSFYRHEEANYLNFPPSSYHPVRGRYKRFQQVEELKTNLTFEATLNEEHNAATRLNVPIKIKNIGQQAWSSEGVLIAYHWWQQDTVVHWDGERSVLEIDLLPQSEHNQYLVVHTPERAGAYVLQIDLIGPGEIGWCHYPTTYPVRIEE